MGSTNRLPAGRLWPVWAAIGMPLLLIVLESTPIAPDFAFVMIGVPALLFAWACLGLFALIVGIRRIKRREWSQALASAILPLAILLAGFKFWNFIHFCNDWGDVVHFIARRHSYVQRICTTPPNGEPRLLVFNLGGMIWASRGYVYDESDEVVNTAPMRSVDWKARADQTELGCGYHADPFPGHFSFTEHWYIASFSC